MHLHYKAHKRKRPWMPLAVVAGTLLLGAMAWCFRSSSRVFSAFELHGGPVVLTRDATPTIVALTSHFETRVFTSNDNTFYTTSTLHWDLWAFSLADLSRRWITRIASIRHAERNIEAGILGVESGTVWVLADELLALATVDGHVIGDAATIESRNPPLHGVMPTSRRQLLFDNGMVVVAADGQRWRIDSRTLVATAAPAGTSVPAGDLDSPAYRPLRLQSQYQQFKTRGYTLGDRWYGLMHPSETAKLAREMIGQDFNQPLRYRLWSAPLHDTVDRWRTPVRIPVGFAPISASPEFLQGGLLTVPDSNGHERVTGIAKPTRFLVLHQDRIDDAGVQTLSCIGLDGRVCWNAPLQMSLATGFAALDGGGPNDWALIVVGEERAAVAGKATDRSRAGYPVFARVAISTGTVQRMSFADIDLARISDEANPYHKR